LAYIWGKGDIEWVKPRPVWGSRDIASSRSELLDAKAEREMVHAE
jgi:hypothetical protein